LVSFNLEIWENFSPSFDPLAVCDLVLFCPRLHGKGTR